MTIQAIVRDQYAQALAPLGDLQQAVDIALRRYVIDEIAAKIETVRRRDAAYVRKYGCAKA